MSKEYKDGKVIITCPSGHVEVYDIAHVEKFKGYLLDNVVQVQKVITSTDADLEQMRISAGITNPVPNPTDNP